MMSQSVRRFTTSTRTAIPETYLEVLTKNQRIYNRKYPTTPITAGQKTFIKVTKVVYNAGTAAVCVGLGLFMSMGVWVPFFINYQRGKIEDKYAELEGEID